MTLSDRRENQSAESPIERLARVLRTDPGAAASLRALANAGRSRGRSCRRALDLIEPVIAGAPPPPRPEDLAGLYALQLGALDDDGYSAAAQIFVRDLTRYASTGWRIEGLLDAPPLSAVGGPRETLWAFLKMDDKLPSARTVRRWLAAGAGQSFLRMASDRVDNPIQKTESVA